MVFYVPLFERSPSSQDTFSLTRAQHDTGRSYEYERVFTCISIDIPNIDVHLVNDLTWSADRSCPSTSRLGIDRNVSPTLTVIHHLPVQLYDS